MIYKIKRWDYSYVFLAKGEISKKKTHKKLNDKTYNTCTNKKNYKHKHKLKMFYKTKLHKYTLNGKQNETRKRIQTSL